MNQSFKSLTVYKKAFRLAMEIFEITKAFPKEELFGLTMQIRKSSLTLKSEEIGRMLNHMIQHPKKYLQSHLKTETK